MPARALHGKNLLDRPYAIFQSLGIPVYVIWDSDEGGRDTKAEDNHRMLRLLDRKIEDWPDSIEDNFACFKQQLMTTFKNEIGNEFFDANIKECCDYFAIGRQNQAIKNPIVIQRIIEEGRKQGKTSPTLENIIMKIMSL